MRLTEPMTHTISTLYVVRKTITLTTTNTYNSITIAAVGDP